MARNGIQFQKGLSLPEFQKLYGAEAQCEAVLEKNRWPDGFRCPHCGGHEHGLVYGRRLKRYQCRSCAHQATLTSGTIMQATKLADRLVPCLLSDWSGQNWYLLAGAEPSPGRQLRHRLAAAQQNPAGDE